MDNRGALAQNVSRMNKAEISLEQLRKYCEHAARERLYGVIELHFENGRIYRVRKMHNIASEEMARLTDS